MNVKYSNVKYIVALYMRLSKDDGDKEESESITNQRKILRAFAKENGYEIYDEYIDDGYSGTNFERPDFKRLIKDIEDKKVNMVITKTLARLGRDYIETGRLIEKFFPENQVRYIALLDDVDSFLDSSTDMVALKNLMNDFYAKETSKNVRKTKNRKRNEGSYYIGYAPFGYDKVDRDGNLKINELQASIVKRIFNEYISGKGTYQIARGLTKDEIKTPGIMMQITTTVKYQTPKTNIWDCTQVRRILLNPIYIGTTVQNKIRKVSYKSKKRIKVPKEEYVIQEEHHEPIIDKKTWDLVQNIYNKSKGTRTGKSDELLKPFLYCHHCNNKLSIITHTRHNKSGIKKSKYVVCPTAINIKSNKSCYRQYNSYQKIEKKVLDKVSEILKKYIDSDFFNNEEIIEKMINTQKGMEELLQKKNKVKSDIEELDKKIKMLYSDRLNGLLQEQDYTFFSEDLQKQRETLLQLKSNIQEEILSYQDKNKIQRIEQDLKDNIQVMVEKKEYTKMDLHKLLKRVEIDKDKNIYIFFKFYELNCIEGEKNNETENI